MDENWYKGHEEWYDGDRPFDPSWNVPPKKSVQSEMPEWKKREIWGDRWVDDLTAPIHGGKNSWSHLEHEGW